VRTPAASSFFAIGVGDHPFSEGGAYVAYWAGPLRNHYHPLTAPSQTCAGNAMIYTHFKYFMDKTPSFH
jgi:hypothetical protein